MKPDLNEKDFFNKTLASFEAPKASSKEDAWLQLQNRLSLNEGSKVVSIQSRINWRRIAAVAAMVVMVLTLSYLLKPKAESLSFTANTLSEIALPDGSKAMLLQDADLVWTVDTGGNRRVKLNGEAFFDVEKGTTFTVETPTGYVEVLGTSFSVYAVGEAFAVECLSGKVSVSDGDQKAIITAGQGTKRRKGVLSTPYDIGVQSYAWQSDEECSYTNADLERVFKHVMQRFGIELRLECSLEGKEFSGTFEMTDAETTLQIITTAMGLELERISENTFAIKEKV